ncbi:MAG: thiazole biosynthesis protein, partial [Vibrionaceae bacterium]
QEEKFDFTLLEKVVREAQISDIRQIALAAQEETQEVCVVDDILPDEIIIDIRSDEEHEAAPLDLPHKEIIHIPFFKLANTFSLLDQSKNYLLYCDKGVMSRLQALYLKENGFNNVKVYSVKKR